MNLEKIMKGARYHEAGHAVAAYHHGMTITGVTATLAESVTSYRRPPYGGWAESWREACITMAGQLADQRASWGEIPPEPWAKFREVAEDELEAIEWGEIDAGGDHAEIMECLELMAPEQYGDDLEESYRIVVNDTRALVSEHWGEIEAVARGLERNGTLDGTEVVQILEGAIT